MRKDFENESRSFFLCLAIFNLELLVSSSSLSSAKSAQVSH